MRDSCSGSDPRGDVWDISRAASRSQHTFLASVLSAWPSVLQLGFFSRNVKQKPQSEEFRKARKKLLSQR